MMIKSEGIADINTKETKASWVIVSTELYSCCVDWWNKGRGLWGRHWAQGTQVSSWDSGLAEPLLCRLRFSTYSLQEEGPGDFPLLGPVCRMHKAAAPLWGEHWSEDKLWCPEQSRWRKGPLNWTDSSGSPESLVVLQWLAEEWCMCGPAKRWLLFWN